MSLSNTSDLGTHSYSSRAGHTINTAEPAHGVLPLRPVPNSAVLARGSRRRRQSQVAWHQCPYAWFLMAGFSWGSVWQGPYGRVLMAGLEPQGVLESSSRGNF